MQGDPRPVNRPAAASGQPAVAVCSVTFNRRALMVRVLEQIRALDYPADCIDVFVVDNASEDDTVERIAADLPEVHLIESKRNLGVSAGFNAAIQAALDADRDYAYIWLLDSDAEIEPGTLAPLIRAMEADDHIGVIGSAVYDPVQRDRRVTVGLAVNWRTAAVEFWPPDSPAKDGLVDVDLIPACSSLTRARLCRTLGLWDERFWLYWGDTDWCARALKEGYRVCGSRESRVWHRDWARVKRDFGAPFVIHDDVRGALLFSLRHSPGHALSGARHLILKSTLRAALEALTMRPDFGIAQQLAVDDFLGGRFERQGPGFWTPATPPGDLDAVCQGLRGRLPERPRILLNRIDDAEQAARIREVLGRHFPQARWQELRPSERPERTELSTDYERHLKEGLPQLVSSLLRIFRRYDVIVSDIAVPHLYNLVAARDTLLVNAAGRAVIRENRLGRGLGTAVATLLRGLKRAYFDLPRAVKRCPPLRTAAEIGAPTGPPK